MAAMTPEELSNVVRYAGYSVFTLSTPLGEVDRQALAAEVEEVFAKIAEQDVVVRGTYDISGLRAEADLMIWWHAPTPDALQDAYNLFRSTKLGSHLTPYWSNVGITRPAEFNRGHVPAFMMGWDPKKYICVYPFVRSYDWYVLDPAERARMLREHGEAAADYKDVSANTISSFALGDYEWLLCFEADEMVRIVDLMRDLRAVDARLHVREETPFFSGRMLAMHDLTTLWP